MYWQGGATQKISLFVEMVVEASGGFNAFPNPLCGLANGCNL